MNQKGITNFILIGIVIVFAGTVGYFVLTRKPETPHPPVDRLATSTSTPDSEKIATTTSGEQLIKTTQQVPTYPFSRYIPLSAAELEKLQRSFKERNGSQWTIELDKFGLLRNAYAKDPTLVSTAMGRNNLYPIVTEEDRNKVKQFIIKNSDFLGIDNPESIELLYDSTFSQLGEPNGFKSVQKFGKYVFAYDAGEPVYGGGFDQATIRTLKSRTTPQDSPNIVIRGHFWSHAQLPARPRLTEEDIAKKVIGREVNYRIKLCPSCPPPPPGLTSSCTCITLSQPPAKIKGGDFDVKLGPHLSQKNHNSPLELRLVYFVPIKWKNFTEQPVEPIDADIFFIDAITGEELKLVE